MYGGTYNAPIGRIEMHLVSTCAQTLRLNGHRFELEAGESVHTENSYKYAPEESTNVHAGSPRRAGRYTGWVWGSHPFPCQTMSVKA